MPVGNKIHMLEGLRGPLAIWVLITHTLQRSGYSVDHVSGPIRFLRSGGNAVDVFILLSGFVITYMLIKKARIEGYSVYLFKRFMRLAPALLFFLVIAILVSDVKGYMILNMPEGSEKMSLLNKYMEAEDNFWLIVLLKATLLHGVVPFELIPNAANGVLEPAWSISLEWQFYLFAPLIVYSIVDKRFSPLFSLTICLYGMYFLGCLFDVTWGKSFIPSVFPFFIIGVVSCLVFQSENLFYQSFLVVGIAGLAVMALLIKGDPWSGPHLGLGIWLCVIICLFFSRLKPVSTFLETRVMVRLGVISYSVYLGHMPMLVVSQYLLGLINSTYSYDPIYLSLLTLALTLPVAQLVYKFVEKPCNEWGKRFSCHDVIQKAGD